MKEITTTSYTSEYDGKSFDNMYDCLAHEKELAKTAFGKFIAKGGRVCFLDYQYKILQRIEDNSFDWFLESYDAWRNVYHMLVYIPGLGDNGWNTLKELCLAVRMSGNNREICYQNSNSPMLQNFPDMNLVNQNVIEFTRDREGSSNGVFVVSTIRFGDFVKRLLGLRVELLPWLDPQAFKQSNEKDE